MKSIFDAATRAEVIRRIDSLKSDNKPQWGKMTVTQMVRHCARCEEYYFGNIKIGRSLLGRIVGKMAIKSILKDELSSIRKNSLTRPAFKVEENITGLEGEKSKWKSLVERYSEFNKEEFTHWFFWKIIKRTAGTVYL